MRSGELIPHETREESGGHTTTTIPAMIKSLSILLILHFTSLYSPHSPFSLTTNMCCHRPPPRISAASHSSPITHPSIHPPIHPSLFHSSTYADETMSTVLSSSLPKNSSVCVCVRTSHRVRPSKRHVST